MIDDYDNLLDIYNKELIDQTAHLTPDQLFDQVKAFVDKFSNPEYLNKTREASTQIFLTAEEHVKQVSGHINVVALSDALSEAPSFSDHYISGDKPYPDNMIVDHLSFGFPDLGGVFKSGLFRDVIFPDDDKTYPCPPGSNQSFKMSRNEARRARVLSEDYRYNGQDVMLRMLDIDESWQPEKICQRVWSNTLKEIESGLMVGPFTLDKAREEMEKRGHSNVTISTLFGVHQPKESDPDRVRSVLNMVDVNEQSFLSEHLIFPNHSELPKWIAYSTHRGEKWLLDPKLSRSVIYDSVERTRSMKGATDPQVIQNHLHKAKLAREKFMKMAQVTDSFQDSVFCLMDFKAAYRQIANRSLATNWVRVFDPAEKKYKLVLAQACQFGSIHSVSNWVRVSELIVHLLRTRLGINAVVYIDDIIMILPRSRAKEIGEQVRILISSVFGFRLDTSKEIFNSEAKILGMIYKISPTGGPTDAL